MLKNLSSLSPVLAARLSARADELFAAEEAIASAVRGVVDLIGDAEAEAIVSAMQAAEAAGVATQAELQWRGRISLKWARRATAWRVAGWAARVQTVRSSQR